MTRMQAIVTVIIALVISLITFKSSQLIIIYVANMISNYSPDTSGKHIQTTHPLIDCRAVLIAIITFLIIIFVVNKTICKKNNFGVREFWETFLSGADFKAN